MNAQGPGRPNTSPSILRYKESVVTGQALPALDEESVAAELARSGIPPTIGADAIAALPEGCKGLLIYGSRARGDHRPDSDLDLLALVAHELGSRSVGQVNLSCYTVEQLHSASGTLFGVHLQRDGIAVFDPGGKLTAALTDFAPLDAQRLLTRVQHYSGILHAADADQYLPGCVRLGKFLLRSAIYAEAITAGEPCFSVRELAIRHNDAALIDVLDSGPFHSATLADLNGLIKRLIALAGPPQDKGMVSLESLVVAEWDTDRERSALAILAMGPTPSESQLDYSLLPKVLL